MVALVISTHRFDKLCGFVERDLNCLHLKHMSSLACPFFHEPNFLGFPRWGLQPVCDVSVMIIIVGMGLAVTLFSLGVGFSMGITPRDYL